MLGCGSFHKHVTAHTLSQSLSKKTNFLQSKNIHVSVVSFSFYLYCIYMGAGPLQGVSNFTRQIQGMDKAKHISHLHCIHLNCIYPTHWFRITYCGHRSILNLSFCISRWSLSDEYVEYRTKWNNKPTAVYLLWKATLMCTPLLAESHFPITSLESLITLKVYSYRGNAHYSILPRQYSPIGKFGISLVDICMCCSLPVLINYKNKWMTDIPAHDTVCTRGLDQQCKIFNGMAMVKLKICQQMI